MSILCDYEIADRAEHDGMIAPFVGHQVREVDGKPVISYGLSSYGYDIRLSNEFLQPTIQWLADPKNPKSAGDFYPTPYEKLIVQPGCFVLGKSVEYFKIPRNILGICVGKSTYARLGVIVNVTPLEPEWEGELTVEISNTSRNPVAIYGNEGIAQLIFHRASCLCAVSYADRAGKYQAQRGVTVARM